MQATRTPDGVYVGGDAYQRLYQARGYGTPTDDRAVLLAPVEAAYLLYRGDLDSVDGESFRAFIERRDAGSLTSFIVYKDLRERGFYLDVSSNDEGTFAVFERGSSPPDGSIAYDVTVLNESRPFVGQAVQPGVLAIVDGEGEVGYISVTEIRPNGSLSAPPAANNEATLAGDRVLVWDPDPRLYRELFFGQPLAGRNETTGPLQLSLPEAIYLAEAGAISLIPSLDTVRQQFRDRAGEEADRINTVYHELRTAGVAPKTGYKFGTHFRVYREFANIDEMGHSDELVRIINPAAQLTPRSLALDVRLAHGVGKRMVFALRPDTDEQSTTWVSIKRETP